MRDDDYHTLGALVHVFKNLDKIVEALMDKTSLSGDEIDKIFSLYSKRK